MRKCLYPTMILRRSGPYLDYRSLYHHFECGTFIYNNPVVWEIERDFQNTLKACQKITMLDVKARRIGMKMVEEF